MRIIIGLMLVFAVACGGATADRAAAERNGTPIDHNMGGGIHCYTYTQGSISCVLVK